MSGPTNEPTSQPASQPASHPTSEPASAPTSALKALSGHTLIYLAGSLCAKLASIVLLPIFTQEEFLSEADYGILEITSTTIAFGLMLLGFQLDAAISRHYFEDEDEDRRKRVISTAFVSLAILSVSVAIPMALSSKWLAHHWLERDDLPNVMALVAAVLVSMVLTEVPLTALKTERRSVAVTGWLLLRLLLEIGLKIGFVVSLYWGVTGVMAGQALAGWIFLIGFSAWTIRRFGARLDVDILRSMVRFSAPMVLAGVGQFALHNADRFMLKELSTDEQLGLYGVGYMFGYAVTSVVLSAFLLIWYPFIFAQKDEREQLRIQGAATLHIPTLILLLSLPVALFAPEIIRLLTSKTEFFAAWQYIPVILASYLFWGLFQVAQTPFYLRKRTADLPRVVVIATAANIGLNFLLIPTMGAMGAALATLFALLLLALLVLRAARSLQEVPVEWHRTAAPICITALAGVVLYAIPQDSPWSLGARIAVLIGGSLWLVGPYLTADERRQARDLIGAVRAKLGGS